MGSGMEFVKSKCLHTLTSELFNICEHSLALCCFDDIPWRSICILIPKVPLSQKCPSSIEAPKRSSLLLSTKKLSFGNSLLGMPAIWIQLQNYTYYYISCHIYLSEVSLGTQLVKPSWSTRWQLECLRALVWPKEAVGRVSLDLEWPKPLSILDQCITSSMVLAWNAEAWSALIFKGSICDQSSFSPHDFMWIFMTGCQSSRHCYIAATELWVARTARTSSSRHCHRILLSLANPLPRHDPYVAVE